MVGPDVTSKGGISASINLLNEYLSDQGLSVSIISTIRTETSKLESISFFIRAIFSLMYILIFSRPDLMHVHMASRGSFLRKSILCLICFLFRTPYIIHLHGGGFREFYSELPKAGKSYLRFIFRRAAHVITLSEFWKEWVMSELHIHRASVVPNGVHNISFLPGELNKSRPIVLFLGLLGQNKGTDILIEAMRMVKSRIPNAALELCGNGDIKRYKEQARDIPNVEFLGWINADERRAALGRATVYCLPSWKEGLPFSIFEAMSAALPVVSTPVGGIPEVVNDGVTGLLVQPGDVHGLANALCQILLDPLKAKSMGLKGQALQRRKYSTEAMGNACLKIYESCA